MQCLSSSKLAFSLNLVLVASAYLPSAGALSSNPSITAITYKQPLPNGTVLVSPKGNFKLCFFSKSRGWYLGIFLVSPEDKFVDAVVWVANRENPIPATASAVLKVFSEPGIYPAIVLVDSKTGDVFWRSPADSNSHGPVSNKETITATRKAFARLEDSGNLVVLLDGSSKTSWQSFDHPTDTLLAGMKIGWDAETGRRWYLCSWKSSDDPSPGSFNYSLEPGGVPQLFVKGPGGTPKTSMGYYNGRSLSGMPQIPSIDVMRLEYLADDNQAYYMVRPKVASVQLLLVLDPFGIIRQYAYNDSRGEMLYKRPSSVCENYLSCGPNSVCDNMLAPNCGCIKGYGPARGGFGCTRAAAFRCRQAGVFEKMTGIKLPDMTNATAHMSMTPKQCEEACLANCSCVAYAMANITSGNACIMWGGELLDVLQFTGGGGNDFFVRPSANSSLSEEIIEAKKHRRRIIVTIIIVMSFTFTVVLVLLLLLHKKRMVKKKRQKERLNMEEKISKWTEGFSLFELSVIISATNNFSFMNKIGRGGFGDVYKGTMNDGQQIAIKRLSLSSRQGLSEFMNEVKLIACLQHRNLVRLLGCCVDENERILVYEYMQNKSLDNFIFGKYPCIYLDWTKRISIIHGIARGLLYLHEDSRLKIVHRDLKAANILLDEAMNPKIADFGTARIFQVDQKEENTGKVIGTIGYMSPEYAIEGNFSMKSDVFSYGVIVLEIISGLENLKNKHVACTYGKENLLALAWRLWQVGETLKLLDSLLVGKCPDEEIHRFIHIGLLCVQESPLDRPTMSSVVLMLGGDNPLPEPKRPGIFHGRTCKPRDCRSLPSTIEQESLAILTITEVGGR